MSSFRGVCRLTCIFVFLFLSIIGDVSGLITIPPLNTVAEVGQQAIFNCTSGTTVQHWSLTAKREDLGTAAAVDIAISCVVQPGFETHYEVDRPGGNVNICNLIVKDVTMQQAGIYTCTDIATGPSAILTVIDSSINITYTSTADVMEGENVIIACSLNYTGPVEPASTLRPHFYWTDYTGNNVSSFYDSTAVNSPAISQLTVTAGQEDIMPYTCHVYMQLVTSATPGYATNTPSVDNSASSPIIITVLSRPASTVTPAISPSTGFIITTTSSIITLSTPITTNNVAVDVAIAMGVLFGISLVANIILAIIVFRNSPSKQIPDLFRRAEDTRVPKILQPSDLSTPSAYEDLRRPNEIGLQPTTYEQLAPRPQLFVNVHPGT